jgi:hypothetical protein
VRIRTEVKADRTSLCKVAGMVVNQHVGTQLAKDNGFAELSMLGVIGIVAP